MGGSGRYRNLCLVIERLEKHVWFREEREKGADFSVDFNCFSEFPEAAVVETALRRCATDPAVQSKRTPSKIVSQDLN